MCAVPIGAEHRHVVDLEGRAIRCTCAPCQLLFSHEGAAQGRYRAVPMRYLYDTDFQMSEGQWDELQIPVGLAFFFKNSAMDEFVALYPSPAGATESELPLDTWTDILAANPDITEIVPDVEALLLRRMDKGTECYLVPIDACYDLVGRVRLHWRGFQGGTEVWEEIDAFFSRLREQGRRLGVGG